MRTSDADFVGAGKACVQLVKRSIIIRLTVSPVRDNSSLPQMAWSAVIASANFSGVGK